MKPSTSSPPESDRTVRVPLPLAPRLFFLGLGLLLTSWLAFMGYYVFVKAKQPQPQPEIRAPGRPLPAPPPAR